MTIHLTLESQDPILDLLSRLIGVLDISGIGAMAQVVHSRPLTSAPDRPPCLKATPPMSPLVTSPLPCYGEVTLSQCQEVPLYTKAVHTLYWGPKVTVVFQQCPP